MKDFPSGEQEMECATAAIAKWLSNFYRHNGNDLHLYGTFHQL